MKTRHLIILAILIYSCSSTNELFQLNRGYESDGIALEVAEYLNQDGLFTLVLKDNQNKDLGKADISIMMENLSDGETYCHELYSVSNPVGMIDDNYLSLDENGRYKIYNQGESHGYSTEEYIDFFPEDIEEGEYNFQVIVETDKEKIYSNIIKIELPIAGVKVKE